MLGKLPHGLPFWHPAALISTWGGSGLLPGARGPGDRFSPCPCMGYRIRYGSEGLLIAAAVTLLAGLWSSARYLRTSTSKDPGTIVDETAGQLLASRSCRWMSVVLPDLSVPNRRYPQTLAGLMGGSDHRRLGNYDGRHLCCALSDGATLRCTDLPYGILRMIDPDIRSAVQPC